MKLLASDFDNTLYFKDRFKEEDLLAIKKFQKEGHLFGICSGNYLNRIKHYSINKVSYDFYITSTGSLIVLNDKIVDQSQISYTSLTALFNTYNEMCKIWIHADYDLYVTAKSTFPSIHNNIIVSSEEIPTDNIHGISLGFNNPNEARLHSDKLNELYKDIEIFQNNECLDIVNRNCNKGNAIRTLTSVISTHKTYGIGDNFNDLPLLEAVDISFTFHTSPKEIQDVCTYVVDSIAEAIEIILKD